MAKRQHFGSFCLALLYNFPSLVYREKEPGSPIAYSTKVQRFHDRTLHSDGTSLSHFDTGMQCEVTPVASMSACDIAASTSSGTPGRISAYPLHARIVHCRYGRRPWRPHRRHLKKIILRWRRAEGFQILGEREEKNIF